MSGGKKYLADLRLVDRAKLEARLAELELMGHGVNKVAAILTGEFNYQFTRTQIEKIKLGDVYQTVIEACVQRYVKQARNRIRSKVSRLEEKILKSLEEQIEKGNIQAIIQGLKILGFEHDEGEKKQEQSLTVILPGKPKEPKDVT